MKKVETERIFIRESTFDDCRYFAEWEQTDTVTEFFTIDKGRNYEEILEQWQLITKKLKVDILVIDMPLLDTRARDGSLTGIFISDLVLQILSYVAQTERENIRQRQREGIQAAKAQGVKFGRLRLEKPREYLEILHGIQSGTLTLSAGAKYLGISSRTLKRWMDEEKVG